MHNKVQVHKRDFGLRLVSLFVRLKNSKQKFVWTALKRRKFLLYESTKWVIITGLLKKIFTLLYQWIVIKLTKGHFDKNELEPAHVTLTNSLRY